MERSIRFATGAITLEGRLEKLSRERAAIVTHPHPLYGGDMDNAVVMVLAETYRRQGWSTLRFNFRGTGGSEGQYDDGIGELSDLQAAIDHIKGLGYRHIDLAGYSFGAWVLAGWSHANPNHDHRLILVSPPVAFIDFSGRTPIPGLAHVFTGNLDDLAPPDQIAAVLSQWHPSACLGVIQGADHSYWGHFHSLQRAAAAAIASIAPGKTN